MRSASVLILLCSFVFVFAGGDDERINPQTIKVGMKGHLTVDGKTMLDLRVQHIIDKSNMVVILGGTKFIWISGFRTEGLVDDAVIKISAPVHVSKTHKYGGNTVFYLEPIREK